MKEQGTGRQHSLRRTTTITITTRSTNTTTGTPPKKTRRLT